MSVYLWTFSQYLSAHFLGFKAGLKSKKIRPTTEILEAAPWQKSVWPFIYFCWFSSCIPRGTSNTALFEPHFSMASCFLLPTLSPHFFFRRIRVAAEFQILTLLLWNLELFSCFLLQREPLLSSLSVGGIELNPKIGVTKCESWYEYSRLCKGTPPLKMFILKQDLGSLFFDQKVETYLNHLEVKLVYAKAGSFWSRFLYLTELLLLCPCSNN